MGRLRRFRAGGTGHTLGAVEVPEAVLDGHGGQLDNLVVEVPSGRLESGRAEAVRKLVPS